MMRRGLQSRGLTLISENTTVGISMGSIGNFLCLNKVLGLRMRSFA